MTSENILDVVGALDEIIRDPVRRQRFVEHPDITLRRAGYEPADVPQQVWNALTRMTFDELKAISDLGFALEADGVFDANLAWKHGV